MNNKTKITLKPFSIEEFFTSLHYVVPEYQREYVWQDEQVEQLMTDINEAFNADVNKEYYVGTAVVWENGHKLELIDGQQRTTTFFILLSVIARLYDINHEQHDFIDKLIFSPTSIKGKQIEEYSLELQYEDGKEYLKNIRDNTVPEIDKRKGLRESTQNLYNAFDVITDFLNRNFPKFEDLAAFTDYVLKQVIIGQIRTDDRSDSLKIFETVNQRGCGLTPMDLLKNMLFMKVERHDYEKLNVEWKKMVDKLEPISNKEPMRFLRYYLTATNDISDFHDGIMPNDKIYTWLIKHPSIYSKNPMGFMEKMNNAAEKYNGFMHKNLNITNDPRNHIRNIYNLQGKSYSYHLVLLLAANKMDEDTFVKFTELLESIIYYSVVTKIPSNNYEKVFARWCPYISKIKTMKDLDSFKIKYVKPIVDKWKATIESDFESLSLAGGIQKYKIRFILARITKYIESIRAGKGGMDSNVEIYMDTKTYDIEHIAPKTCKKPEKYLLNEENYRTEAGRLGNLTILETSLNKKIKNNSYKSKCENAYKNSSVYLTRIIYKKEGINGNSSAANLEKRMKFWPKWNINSIKERQKLLYEFSEEIWSIK